MGTNCTHQIRVRKSCPHKSYPMDLEWSVVTFSTLSIASRSYDKDQLSYMDE